MSLWEQRETVGAKIRELRSNTLGIPQVSMIELKQL